MIAGLALWVLGQIEEQALTVEKADRVFTLLDVYLTDNDKSVSLSKEAQELIFEGELFHHYGQPEGPGPRHIEALASIILRRAEEVPA